MAELASTVFYGWTALTDIFGVLGILLGYWKIDRSLYGVLVGYAAVKILQFALAPVLLGFVT